MTKPDSTIHYQTSAQPKVSKKTALIVFAGALALVVVTLVVAR